jgi:hypothetical protein
MNPWERLLEWNRSRRLRGNLYILDWSASPEGQQAYARFNMRVPDSKEIQFAQAVLQDYQDMRTLDGL